jgi:hypothetical protein
MQNPKMTFIDNNCVKKIVNYGIGGYYAPHHDFLYDPGLNDYYGHMGGNRMATWMIYVN